jgi:integrase
MKLTQDSVSRLALEPGERERFVWDDDLKGFGLRMRQAKSTWIIQYRTHGIQARMKIGDLATLSADLARKDAKAKLAAATLGNDPRKARAETRAKNAVRFGPLVEKYLAGPPRKRNGEPIRNTTLNQVTRDLKVKWKPLHSLPLANITRADVAARLIEIRDEHGKQSAIQARTVLSGFFAWAIGGGVAESNPVVGTNPPGAPNSRKRVLTGVELRAIWAACQDDDFGAIVKLLMLTGQRRAEVAGMTWAELDLQGGLWTIPEERYKTEREQRVPLSDFVLEILRNVPQWAGRDHPFGKLVGIPFQGFDAAKKALDARIAVAQGKALDPWILHDLRRTVATMMAESPENGGLGINPHIADAVLGHVGIKKGVMGIYNRATNEPEIRNALQRWAEHVRGIVTGDRKIEPLPQRRVG